MKRTAIFTVIPFVLVASLSPLPAQPRSDRGQRMAEKLDLSEEQVQTMKKLRAEHMKLMTDHMADVRKANIDLRILMDDERPDKAAIKAKMKEIAGLRLNAAHARIDHQFDVRSMLTPEQQKRWKRLTRERFQEREGRGFARPGRRGMRNEMMRNDPGSPRHQRMYR